MSRSRLLILVLLAGLFATLGNAAAPPQSRLDIYGDPLPPGAVARLGTQRFHHPWSIDALAYSPDGKMLASSSLWEVCVREAKTGRLVRRFATDVKESAGSQVVFSRDGKRLASVHYSCVHVWDLTRGKELYRFDAEKGSNLLTAAFSPDGESLVTGGKDRVCRWDLKKGKLVGDIGKGHGMVQSLVFTADGKSVVTFGTHRGAGVCRVWEVKTGKELASRNSPQTGYPAGLSPGGTWAAVVESRSAFHLLSTQDKSSTRIPVPRKEKENDSRVELTIVIDDHGARMENNYSMTISFSADGKRVAAGERGGSGVIWDTAAEKVIGRFPSSSGALRSLALSPDGKTLAIGTWRCVRFWDVDNGKQIAGPPLYPEGVGDVAFGLDGSTVVTVAKDASRVWDAADGKLLERKVPSDGRGQSGGVVRLREGAGPIPQAGTYSPNGKRLILGSGGSLVMLDQSSGKELWSRTDSVPKEPAQRLTRQTFSWPLGFSRAGDVLLFQKNEFCVQFLSADDGIPYSQLDQEQGLTLSSNGSYLATRTVSTGKRSLKVWDLTNIYRPRALTLPTGIDGDLVAFAPDERTMAVGRPGEILVVETFSWQVIRRLREPANWLTSLAFSGDGRLLASSDGSTALVWTVVDRGEARSRDLEPLWRDLAGDAVRARRAVWALTDAGRESVALIASRLKPRPAAPRDRVARLIEDLAGDDPKARERAAGELLELGDQSSRPLERLLAQSKTPAARQRVEQLLRQLNAPLTDGNKLRELRAIHVLEQIGTLEGRTVLRRIEGNASGTRLGMEAKSALQRLARQR
jgi:WD40 repeat protein